MPEAEVPDVHELEEHAKDMFTKRVAQTTAGYAVILAIAALGGNNAMKEMLIAQQQASNTWARYQAKVIREHAYKTEANRIELLLAERGMSMSSEARAKAEKLLKHYKAESKRFATEKKEEIAPDARKWEAIRDKNQKKDPYFDFAEVLLQISIVIASVAILAKAKKVFYFSIGLAVIGAFLTFNGYTLAFDIPFIGDH
jgi:Mg2+/citrate symporter